jgi:hypothetical protein
MKLSLTTTISMASIVAAGAAAYAINVNVLEAPAATNPAAIAAPTADTLATPVNGQASTQSIKSPLAIQEVSVSTDTTKYQVGTAGAVLLSGSDSTLNVSSITPAAGWTSEPARTQPDGSVKVHFISGSQRLEFTARKVNGKVVTSVVEEMPPAPAPGMAPAPGNAPVPIGGAPTGSLPSSGVKPQIPSAIGGDDDDDEDDDDHDEDHDDDDRKRGEDHDDDDD